MTCLNRKFTHLKSWEDYSHCVKIFLLYKVHYTNNFDGSIFLNYLSIFYSNRLNNFQDFSAFPYTKQTIENRMSTTENNESKYFNYQGCELLNKLLKICYSSQNSTPYY